MSNKNNKNYVNATETVEDVVGTNVINENKEVDTVMSEAEPVVDIPTPVVENTAKVEPVIEKVPEVKPEKKVEPVKTEVKVNTTKKDDVVNFVVGQEVTIKSDVNTTITGTVIPVFAKNNIYKVFKVMPNRVIIKCETLMFALSANDIQPVLK